jgi:uncharacterized protein YbjT (DUF2867 family)
MLALYEAAAHYGLKLIVQISVAIGGRGADLPFIATKRAADEALIQSGVPHVILRPALVVGLNAHGGTALIRSLASFPLILPLIYADRPVQTVALSDVAEAVSACLDGRIAPGNDRTLAAPQIHTWPMLYWRIDRGLAPDLRLSSAFRRYSRQSQLGRLIVPVSSAGVRRFDLPR